MTKKLRTELAHSISDLARDVQALNQRLDVIVARIDWMKISEVEQRRILGVEPAPVTTEKVWATPPRPRFRFLNGSWPVRDGNTYPRIDLTRSRGPLGGYESYVRRSPPATE